MADGQQAFSVKEAADLVGVSTDTIYRSLEDGELDGAKIRGMWRISKSDLESWYRSRGGGSLFGDEGPEDDTANDNGAGESE